MALDSLPPIAPPPAPAEPGARGRGGSPEFTAYDEPVQNSRESVAQAPSYLGVFYVRSNRPAVMVDNALSLEMDSVEDLRSRFCLKARLRAGPGKGEDVAIMLPAEAERPDSNALRHHFLGKYRLRILRLSRIADDTPGSELWATEGANASDFAASVVVDVPVECPVPSATRGTCVLRPVGVGESVQVWMSTRCAREQHIVFGQHEDDQLDLRLTTETDAEPVLRLRESHGEWEKSLCPGEEAVWLWKATLDVFRLGDVEAHVSMALNYRDRKLVSCGAIRPESRTKTKLGRTIVAGDYTINVKERVGSLCTMGVSGRRVEAVRAEQAEASANHLAGDGEKVDTIGDLDWEELDDVEGGQPRVLETSYPLLNFGVLLQIERTDAATAEDAAWGRLLG